MNLSLKTLSLSILLGTLLIKCAHSPKTDFLSYPSRKPEKILEKNSLNSSLINSIEASATTKIISEKGSFVFKMFIYYDNEKKIRIENTTPFGNPISSFIGTEKEIILHDISNNILVIGKNKLEHFEKLIQIPLNSEEFYKLISLEIPASFKQNKLYETDKKYYFINEKSRFLHGHFLINNQNLISSITLNSETNELKIEYENYRQYGEILFPRIISIKTKNYFIKINFKKIAFNKKFSNNTFILNINKNIERIYLED